MAGVYWTGADGNIWVKDSQGVTNYGTSDSIAARQAASGSTFDIRTGYTQIADPNAPAQAPQNTATNNTTGAVSAPVAAPAPPPPVLNQTAVNNTNAAIGSLDTETNTGYANIDGGYNSLIGGYDTETSRANADYQEQDVSNNTTLQRNKQNALQAAAQGRRGLRGTLASMGALSGTGAELADRAVATSANEDIGEASETFGNNAGLINKAKERFDEDDTTRRAEAVTAKANQRTNLEGRIAGKRQGMFKTLGDLYKEGGQAANADNYYNQAGALNETIAQKTAIAPTAFSAKGAAFTPGKLQDYLAGAGDMTVSVAEGGQGGQGPSITAGRKIPLTEEEKAKLLVA